MQVTIWHCGERSGRAGYTEQETGEINGATEVYSSCGTTNRSQELALQNKSMGRKWADDDKYTLMGRRRGLLHFLHLFFYDRWNRQISVILSLPSVCADWTLKGPNTACARATNTNNRHLLRKALQWVCFGDNFFFNAGTKETQMRIQFKARWFSCFYFNDVIEMFFLVNVL